jgi:hypothetical protein
VTPHPGFGDEINVLYRCPLKASSLRNDFDEEMYEEDDNEYVSMSTKISSSSEASDMPSVVEFQSEHIMSDAPQRQSSSSHMMMASYLTSTCISFMSEIDMILETSMLAEESPDHREVDEKSCRRGARILLDLVMKPIEMVRKTVDQPFRKRCHHDAMFEGSCE